MARCRAISRRAQCFVACSFRKEMRKLLKRLIPTYLLGRYRRARLNFLRMKNAKRTPREVFSAIYERNEWGGTSGEYCSGSGSSTEHAAKYSEVVRAFIIEHNISSVVDLGCGDFVVGQALCMRGLDYTGIDVVAELVQRNQSIFGQDSVRFLCLDIVADELPPADLCLLRQVLQHLSNSEIQAILPKLKRYKYVLVTEHYPAQTIDVIPNKDKAHGPDTRLSDRSAVYLDLPPFGVQVSKLLLEVDARNPEQADASSGGLLRTILIAN